MHAFLLTGTGDKQKEIQRLTKLHSQGSSMEFSIEKIDDVRELNKFVRLTVNTPTCIVIKNIDEATTQALNAFLKNLEEPQDNVRYVLTAKSEKSVLGTISSRCHLIKTSAKNKNDIDNDSKKFVKAPTPERFKFIDKIKKRDEAKEFLENLIITCHTMLHNERGDSLKIAKMIKQSNQTLSNVIANGNVSLQLTNLVLSLEQP